MAGNPFRVVKYSDGIFDVKTDRSTLCLTIMLEHCKFGYSLESDAIADAILCFHVWFKERMKDPAFVSYIETLRGHNLSCWCRIDDLCHVDVILNELKQTK